MEKLRAEHAAFDSEADTWLPDTGNDHILAIGRYYRREQLIALFNFSDEPQTAWLRDDKAYTDLVTGRPADAGAVLLPPGEFRWFLHNFDL
jgi:amylosucrase